MKKYLVLTSILALAACGGGSGGGYDGGAGIPGQIEKPTIATGDKTFLVDHDSGLSMIDINKTRNANYENAIAITKSIEAEYSTIIEPQTSRTATRNATRSAAKSDDNFADIDAAYQTMHDVLVRTQVSDKTNRDILLSLALSGLSKDEILALLEYNNDTSLNDTMNKFKETLGSDNKPAELNKIITNADYIYKDFGQHFDLDLDNARFDATGEGGHFTFVFENGAVRSLKTIDTDDNEFMGDEYTVAGGGRFEVTIQGTDYGFDSSELGFNFGDVSVTYTDAEKPTDEKVRDDLFKIIQRSNPNALNELAVLQDWIKTAPIVEIGKCVSESGCIEVAYAHALDSITVESRGKELGLKYSDFGLKLDETKFYNDDERFHGITYREHTVFAGGYADKEADAPQSDMEFTGLAYAGVTSKSNNWENEDDYQEPEVNMYNGTAKLTVNHDKGALNQKLVADFTNEGWYKVTVDDMQSHNVNNIHFEGTPNADALKEGTADLDNMQLKYYGPDKATPTEATGFVQYVVRDGESQNGSDWVYKADISFGVKRDQ